MKKCRVIKKVLIGCSLSCLVIASAAQTDPADLAPGAANEGQAVSSSSPFASAETAPLASAELSAVVAAPAASTTPAEPASPVPTAPAPEAAKLPAEPAREPAPVVETRSSRTVAELANLIHKDRRALYISSEGSYQFYVGGVLKAKYFPEEQKLVLLDMAVDQAQPCNYGIDGKLQTKAKGNAAAETAKSCSRLMEKLNSHLPK